MTGGVGPVKGNRYNYANAITWPSILACACGGSGGLLFGYDLGVTGGIVAMEKFQDTFFPHVYKENHGFKQTSPYCKFNSAILQLFPSSLYIAGFFSALVASYISKAKGRKFCMILAGICYVIGAVLTTATPAKENGLAQLIVGRVMLGIGVGFANASVTVYSAEMSPPKYRGALVLLFQWCTTFGILVAQLINYGTATDLENGWRISLAIAGVPAILILVGGILAPETPSFFCSKDRFDEAREVLKKIRGSEDVEAELNDMIVQTRQAKLLKHPIGDFFVRSCYRPYLSIAIIIAICHQLSGSNAINFYAPQIFSTLGHGRQSSLLNSVILGSVKCGASILSILLVDRIGRKTLLIGGGVVMVCSVVTCGIVMGYYFNNNHGKLPKNVSDGVLALICIFLASYECSWGPLAWLMPAEVMPAEVRTAGMSVATATNFLFSFITGQTFLSMMCTMHFWVFIFFACIVVFGIFFVIYFVPECKGLPIEEVYEAFTHHWLWSKCDAPPRDLSLPEVDMPEGKNGVAKIKSVELVK